MSTTKFSLKGGMKEDSIATCIYHNELFWNFKYEEGWIKFCKCREWAHEHCAGTDDEDDKPCKWDFCA